MYAFVLNGVLIIYFLARFAYLCLLLLSLCIFLLSFSISIFPFYSSKICLFAYIYLLNCIRVSKIISLFVAIAYYLLDVFRSNVGVIFLMLLFVYN